VLVNLKLWRNGDVAVVSWGMQKDHKAATIAERESVIRSNKVAVNMQFLAGCDGSL
jgi:hypothetical protein